MRAVVILALLTASAVAAPVRGVVTAQATGRPIVGATVFTDRGALAVTDEDGYFSLELTPDDHSITVAASGYASRSVAASDALLRIALTESASDEVIEVSGKAPEETKPLSYQLRADEVSLVPGTGNDILRATQALPGVSRIPYSFGGLVLRGTSPRDTEVYLDGIEVPIAFHFGGLTSFYPTSMLSELAVTSGGFDVEYGRAEGGVVTLTTREPRTDRWRVGGKLGLLDSGAVAEGPVAGGGVLVGVRYSYFDSVVGPFVSDDLPLPSWWDAQLRGSFGDPTHLGRVTPLLFLSIDRVANQTSGAVGAPEQVAITTMFVRVAAPYVRQWGPVSLKLVPWLGTNWLAFENTNEGNRETFKRPMYPGGARATLTRDYGWGHLRGGIDTNGGYLSHSQYGFTGDGQGPMQSNGTSTVSWFDMALWSEARIKLDGERFAVKPGVRLDYFGLSNEWVVDPRINIHQKLSSMLTLRQAVGRFHQPPIPGDVDPMDGNPALDSSYFDQASLGIDADFGNAMASVTGFVGYGKRLGVRVANPMRPDDDYEPDTGGLGPTFEMLLEKQLGFAFYRDNRGRGRSAGIELMVKANIGRWFGMVAYTLSKAERNDDHGWHPFELDQRHNLNVIGSVAVERWRFGARVQVVTGNPYTPTTCSALGDPLSCASSPWAGRLPTFFQLGVRADRRWTRCYGDLVLFIDIQNATNYANVEGRNFDETLMRDTDMPGLPIMPFVGLELIPR